MLNIYIQLISLVRLVQTRVSAAQIKFAAYCISRVGSYIVSSREPAGSRVFVIISCIGYTAFSFHARENI